MDFFKSVFSDDPKRPRPSDSDPSEPEPEPPGAWSFGGLIRTLAIQSESVIETYRRDLQEFTTGLKKEIEVAQGSLETMINSTAQIVSQGKESILAVDLDTTKSNRATTQNRYSRFDSQVRAVQCDARTYTEEPEDLSDYKNWKSGLDIDLDSKERIEEMKGLFGENGAMESVYKRVVPDRVDHETFWFRYLYKVHKLKKNEELRAKLVRRAISSGDHDDEELNWDVDDSDDENENDGENQNSQMGEKLPRDDVKDVNSHVADENVGGSSNGRESFRGIGDPLASGQRLAPEEEEIDWDEIEDPSSIDHDGKRIAATRSKNPNRADLRKRLSSAEEEEDLSWDIEGDDD